MKKIVFIGFFLMATCDLSAQYISDLIELPFKLFSSRKNKKKNAKNTDNQNSITEKASTEKLVTLVVSGTGFSKEEAIKNALRSAIEQAYGTFVSANTQVVNDELVKDEIATISSGNIQKYEELSSIKIAGGVEVTLKADVSLESLISFAKNRGMEVELAGATFAMNMKMKQLNKENEEKTLPNLRNQLIKICEQGIFDYELITKDPTMCEDGEHYMLQLIINVKMNKNTRKFYDHLYKTLRAYSLTKDDFFDYVKTNVPYYIYDTDMFYLGKGYNRNSSDFLDDKIQRSVLFEPRFDYYKYFLSDYFYLRSKTLATMNIQGVLLSAIKMFYIKDNLNNKVSLYDNDLSYDLHDGYVRGHVRTTTKLFNIYSGLGESIEKNIHGAFRDFSKYYDIRTPIDKMRSIESLEWDKGLHFNNIMDYYRDGHMYPNLELLCNNPDVLYIIKLSLKYSHQELSQLRNIIIEPIHTTSVN